jgi:hypothetical protein
MPITHLPEADVTDVTVVMHPTPDRAAAERMTGTAAPLSEELLPSDGPQPPAPVSAPRRALALDARRLLGRAGAPGLPSPDHPDRTSAPWSDPRFEQEVAVVLLQLAPIRTRRALASSSAREAFCWLPASVDRDGHVPVRLAYALRWRELAVR